jgi:hypothetical protein
MAFERFHHTAPPQARPDIGESKKGKEKAKMIMVIGSWTQELPLGTLTYLVVKEQITADRLLEPHRATASYEADGNELQIHLLGGQFSRITACPTSVSVSYPGESPFSSSRSCRVNCAR